MAIGIQNQSNIDAASAAYPNGNIKDRSGSTPGTPVNKKVYADIHQFFAKLLREAGITANNTPDNETNGYQYYQALLNDSGWIPLSAYNTGYSGSIQYRRIRNRVQLTGTVVVTFASTDPSLVFATLPVGFRPPLSVEIAAVENFDGTVGLDVSPMRLFINSSGAIGGASGSRSGHTTSRVFLDGISFLTD